MEHGGLACSMIKLRVYFFFFCSIVLSIESTYFFFIKNQTKTKQVGLFPSNYFAFEGERIRGDDDDDEIELSDDDDAVNAENDEFEQEERMLAELGQKQLDALAGIID